MDPWIQVVLGAAAVVTALGILWQKVGRPMWRASRKAEEMLPLLVELTDVFKANPSAFKVLDDIAAQFRTDSGSSLRDVVNRLETSANSNQAATERAAEASERVSDEAFKSAALLAVGVESQRLLGERDREQLSRLLRELDRLTDKVNAGSATGLRIEAAADHVAENLAVAQKAVDGVASDLALSHKRADDAAENHPPGAAADEAAKSAPDAR